MKSAKIIVKLKDGILDPKGQAIKNAIQSLGYENIADVKQGKYFEISIDDSSDLDTNEIIDSLSNKLLSNPIIENYQFEIE